MIATTLFDATSALDFNKPLESHDLRWVDLSKARGSDSTRRILNLFLRQPEGSSVHIAFASHRGAGKTTELKRLAADLSDRYHPVYFEANVEMDSMHFEMEDLLLVIARSIEQEMREQGSPLDSKLLDNIEKWFSDVILSDEQAQSFLAGVKAEAKAEGGIPFFAKLMASLTTSLRVESDHRVRIKQTLKKFPGTLLQYVNNLLNQANDKLAEQNKSLLLIIDNMDRYEPKIIDQLLVQSSDRFKGLACHLIVTPPISLVLRPESQSLDEVFRCEIMPTVKLRNPDQPYDEFSGPGRDCLLAALNKRIDLNKLIPSSEARDMLVAASGGAIRELLEMAQNATLEASGEIITKEDVEKTLAARRNRLRDRIDANGWWGILKKIARNHRSTDDSEFLQVMFQRLAFQYNGDVWYDVHPLITQLPDFKQESVE